MRQKLWLLLTRRRVHVFGADPPRKSLGGRHSAWKTGGNTHASAVSCAGFRGGVGYAHMHRAVKIEGPTDLPRRRETGCSDDRSGEEGAMMSTDQVLASVSPRQRAINPGGRGTAEANLDAPSCSCPSSVWLDWCCRSSLQPSRRKHLAGRGARQRDRFSQVITELHRCNRHRPACAAVSSQPRTQGACICWDRYHRGTRRGSICHLYQGRFRFAGWQD